MSETTGVLRGIERPADLWDADAAAGLGTLDEARLSLEPARRRPRAREPGRREHLGKGHRASTTRAARRASSGSRARAPTWRRSRPPASPRSGSTRSCRSSTASAMDDAEMVDYLLRCALAPDQPRPSIETLLHAFVGAAHVDHTHPDAVIALTSSPDGRRLADEAFGDEAVWLDYQRPGFAMSKRIAELLCAQHPTRAPCSSRSTASSPGARPAPRATRATLEFVTRAARSASAQAGGSRFGLGGPVAQPLDDEERRRPARRGRCRPSAAPCSPTPAASSSGSTAARRRSRSPRRVRAPEVSQIGAPCPDHLIHTKHKPLVVDFDPARDGPDELRAALRERASPSTRPGTASTTSAT